ncbi:hypothetical protein XENTR_v10004922 [Xenopus tropicalis]|nr:hypothetical protein XENTR_v10004922 [Xenopus tropicalis]
MVWRYVSFPKLTLISPLGSSSFTQIGQKVPSLSVCPVFLSKNGRIPYFYKFHLHLHLFFLLHKAESGLHIACKLHGKEIWFQQGSTQHSARVLATGKRLCPKNVMTHKSKTTLICPTCAHQVP